MALSIQQQNALDIAISGHNLLLLGSPGTGKSYTLQKIYDRLVEQGKTVKLTCSTGIACSIYPSKYDAVTLHQFTGIDDGRHDPDKIQSVLRSNPKYTHVVENVLGTDCVIVDECSMISGRTFDALANVLHMKDPDKLCGGIQLVFCGDFLQLPPVPNKHYQDEGLYCFESPLFERVFPHSVYLRTNIRQNEDQLVKCIHEVCLGHISEASRAFLTTLQRPLPSGTNSVKVFSNNLLVDDHNRDCLLKHPGDLYEFRSTDSGEIQELETLTAQRTLWLKIGCPVILLRNLSSRLVNGLRGTLIAATDKELTIQFPGLLTTVGRFLFTVFDPVKNTNIATREQYPVKPAFGLTIHKAQGMTLPSIEVDCRDIFKSGQLGVAMSRVTTSQGLRVINFHPRYVISPPKVVLDFLERDSTDTHTDFSCCKYSERFPNSTPGRRAATQNAYLTYRKIHWHRWCMDLGSAGPRESISHYQAMIACPQGWPNSLSDLPRLSHCINGEVEFNKNVRCNDLMDK